MALKDIKKAIGEFLTSPEPSVLALSCNWGTGKTFIWQKCINCPEAKLKWYCLDRQRRLKKIKHYFHAREHVKKTNNYFKQRRQLKKKYAYISASNCQNINELKTALLSLSRPKSRMFFSSFGETLKSVTNLPLEKIIEAGLGALAEQITKNALICIDDIERAADKIDPYEILNYAAYLRDEGNCKVVLLLNKNQIDIKNKEKFERALEKGTNQFLQLNLTPKEAGDIWKNIIQEKKQRLSKEEQEKIFPEKWIEPFLSITIELGICNIRVLEHLSTALNRWHEILRQYENSKAYSELQDYIFLGTIITGWGHFEPDFCLSWGEYLKREQLQLINSKKALNEEHFNKNDNIEDDNKFNKIENFLSHRIVTNRLNHKHIKFALECFLNIHNGYLPNNAQSKIKDFIDTTKERYKKIELDKIVQYPNNLLFGGNSIGDTTEEFNKALEAIPLNRVSEMSFVDVDALLQAAGYMRKDEWCKKFIKKYIEAIPSMDKNLFPWPLTEDDSIQASSFFYSYPLFKEAFFEWKATKEPATKEEELQNFLDYCRNGGLLLHKTETHENNRFTENKQVLSSQKWKEVLTSEPHRHNINIMRVISKNWNLNPIAFENFENLKHAVQELMQEKPIWKARFAENGISVEG